MANACPVNSYCNMKFMQIIICKYKIKLKSEEEFGYTCKNLCVPLFKGKVVESR